MNVERVGTDRLCYATGSEEGSKCKLRRSARTRFWLITKHENGQMSVLVLNPDGGEEEILPVFSFEKEAEIFLRSEAPRTEGWRVRESTLGELVLVLLGVCAGVARVALDPPPVRVGGEAMIGLLSLSRAKFLLGLMDEHEFSASLQLASHTGGVEWRLREPPRRHQLRTQSARANGNRWDRDKEICDGI